MTAVPCQARHPRASSIDASLSRAEIMKGDGGRRKDRSQGTSPWRVWPQRGQRSENRQHLSCKHAGPSSWACCIGEWRPELTSTRTESYFPDFVWRQVVRGLCCVVAGPAKVVLIDRQRASRAQCGVHVLSTGTTVLGPTRTLWSSLL